MRQPPLCIRVCIHRTHQVDAVTGETRSVGIKNLDAAEVARHAWRLRNQSGHRVVDVGNPVRSKHESIQGVWSPATAFEKMEITFVEAR